MQTAFKASHPRAGGEDESGGPTTSDSTPSLVAVDDLPLVGKAETGEMIP